MVRKFELCRKSENKNSNFLLTPPSLPEVTSANSLAKFCWDHLLCFQPYFTGPLFLIPVINWTWPLWRSSLCCVLSSVSQGSRCQCLLLWSCWGLRKLPSRAVLLRYLCAQIPGDIGKVQGLRRPETLHLQQAPSTQTVGSKTLSLKLAVLRNPGFFINVDTGVPAPEILI